MAALYNAPVGVELYALRTPQQIRIENRLQFMLRAQMKQTHRTKFDRAILEDAADTLNLKRPLILDPAWMYQQLYPFFLGTKGLMWLQPWLRFATLPVPDLPPGVEIPPQTVAVKFYFRCTFPATDQTIAFARESVRQIASQQPVILLDTGLHVDDHLDLHLDDIPNVRRMSDLVPVTVENNLAMQAAVIARCCGFVGTYGGTAQLALRYEKPTVSVYTDWLGTAFAHRQLSEALAVRMEVPFVCVKLGDGPLLQRVLPQFIQK